MIRKTAGELNVGDTFYRETYKKPEPGVDWSYTVERMQRFWQHDFFGKQSERIDVYCRSHITGPAKLTLGPDDPVWITTDAGPPPQAPSPGGRGRIWRSRRQG